MERRLLVAISNDTSALHGVKFITDFFRDFSDLKVTLFASLPARTSYWEEQNGFASLADIEEMCAALYSSFEQSMEKAKDLLVQGGMASENITTKTEPCRHSTELHLTLEGIVGRYDALVLGRRGLESLSQLFDDSLTERLFSSEIMLPCWACRQFEPGRKNILLCMDRSPVSTALADHLAFILGQDASHTITLFHVLGSKEQERDSATQIMNTAAEMLDERGFSTHRVQVKFAVDSSPSRSILREAQEGRYALVAIGRKGEIRSGMRSFFLSSTGKTVLRDLTGAALLFGG
ncbi:MAG: universal stress protein [Proteobacteria bacterium]|nr:universal stress protein [Pseudomonadota bacterium]